MNNSTLNNLTDENKQRTELSSLRAADIFMSISCGLTGAAGLPGNFLVIFLTLKTQEIYSQSYNWLLFNLGLVDFVVCFQNLFLQTIFITNNDSVGCKIFGFVNYLFSMVGIILPAIVALNRYIKVVKEHLFSKWFSKWKMVLYNLLPVVWCALMFTPFAFLGLVGYEGLGVCGVILSSPLVTMCLAPMPILTMLTSYSVVIYSYYGFRKKLKVHAQNSAYLKSPLVKESKSIMKATKFICYIPLVVQGPTILCKVLLGMGWIRMSPWIPRVVFMFFPLTSTCNPYITLTVVKPYKKAASMLFRSRKIAEVVPVSNARKTLRKRNLTSRGRGNLELDHF